MSKEIVKYHNDMASVYFPDFSPTDHNVFMAICYLSKEKGTEEQLVYFDELKKLAGFNSKDDKRFLKYMEQLATKLHGAYYMQKKEDGGFKSFGLFTKFETVGLKTKRPGMLLGVNSDFAYILNSEANLPRGILPLFSAGYTSFELEQHNNLSSVYSKITFRLLKKFKRTGWWHVSIEEFRQLLVIPESYAMKDINRRVLKPIMEELPEYFENLRYELYKGGETGRSVVSIKFSFEPQLDRAIWTDRDIEELGEEYRCRFCGKPLYRINSEDGIIFYGHKEGWKADAPCRRTFGSLEEILGKNGGLPENPQPAEEAHSNDKAEKTDENKKDGLSRTKTKFKCRYCGQYLYIFKNDKGEQFYGHIDGYKKDAVCRKTFSTIAEIKGYSETPTREDYAAADYELIEDNEENREKIKNMTDNLFGTFETIKN